MSLKERMKLEAALFFNPNEFGEILCINGHSLPGLWDDTTEPRPHFHDVGGINMVERTLFLHFSETETLEEPVPGQEIEIDGALWLVKEISRQDAIAKLTLYRHVS